MATFSFMDIARLKTVVSVCVYFSQQDLVLNYQCIIVGNHVCLTIINMLCCMYPNSMFTPLFFLFIERAMCCPEK